MRPDPRPQHDPEKDLPDPRPVYEDEANERHNDPGGKRPRLPDTEGENITPPDFEGNPPPKPTHNP